MNKEALEFWRRGLKALKTARQILSSDADAAASRAYYSAFNAVTALFSLQNKTFSKHSALEVAVHRDLVKQGHWSIELGADYSSLLELRATGDFGGLEHVSESNAKEAIKAAERILDAVHQAHPDIFKSG